MEKIIMQKLQFIVPGNPLGKQRPKIARRGAFVRAYTPEQTVNYEGLVKYCAQQALKTVGGWHLHGAFNVHLAIVVPVPKSWPKRRQDEAVNGFIYPTKKPDVDNIEKIIFDGLNNVAWNDDKQVVGVTKSKRYGAIPNVKVTIELIGDEAP